MVLGSIGAVWAVGALCAWLMVDGHKVDQSRAQPVANRQQPHDGFAGIAPAPTVAAEAEEYATWTYVLSGMACVLLAAVILWAARDAKARGVEGWSWIPVFVALSGGLFVFLYIGSRPAGDLTICPSCEEQRLPGGLNCPHCGSSRRSTP
jgi:hypothetical protein